MYLPFLDKIETFRNMENVLYFKRFHFLKALTVKNVYKNV